MSTAQIAAWLEAAHEDVGRLLAPTSDGHEHRPAIVHATHRLYDARPALPGAQDFDSDRISSSGSHSNPPPGFGQDDRAKADREEAHRRARRIRDDADWLIRMTQRWNPREATPRDRDLSAVNHSEPLCAHCSRWVTDKEPVHRTSDCNGNLPAPMALGRWCYDFVNRNNRLPKQNECERHDRGQVIRLPA